MIRIITLYLPLSAFLLLLVFSCEQKTEQFCGQVILSSKFDFDDASVYGYNFELGKQTQYPSAGEPLPDIVVYQIRRIDGSSEPGFSSPSNTYGFYLAGTFDNLEGSLAFFNEQLGSADPSAIYTASTDTVSLHQVWVLKTSAEHYAKIHVRKISTVGDPAGEHAEVLIDYCYQPDGSPDFPEEFSDTFY